MLFKSIIQIASAITMYVILVFFTPDPILAILLCCIFGINLGAIGFNIMHEGGHMSFSRHTWLNQTSSYFLNVLGGNIYFWKIKHNLNHHTYTNIEGMDSDIDIGPFMRVHEEQKRRWFHRFQHIYCFLLYGISYFVWVFYEDFVKYFSGKASKASPIRKMAVKEHIVFWASKLFYTGLFIVIPIFFAGFVNTIIGFSVMLFVIGLSISIVFQLAHVVEHTQFPTPDPTSNMIEQEWAIHQVSTTANFSTKSKIVSWLVGGLNFQVEHHLFPKISHVHYPKINQFVKETCEEFNIKYNEYGSMYSAIQSHLTHIKKLGKAV